MLGYPVLWICEILLPMMSTYSQWIKKIALNNGSLFPYGQLLWSIKFGALLGSAYK